MTRDRYTIIVILLVIIALSCLLSANYLKEINDKMYDPTTEQAR